jgi:hypothetical protein
MEKPTGVIQKIIESLQQVNALNTYSPIEKDIILHNLRAAYMIFLNLRVEEQNEECRVERLFEASDEEVNGEQYVVSDEEVSDEEVSDEEVIIEEEIIEEEIIEEEIIEEEKTDERMSGLDDEDIVEDEIFEEEKIEKEVIEEEVIEEEVIEEEVIEEEVIEEEVIEEEKIVEEPLVEEPLVEEPFVDDILEFIPDAKPQSTLLFDDATLPKPEKKSLNDLLTEKKDDNSLGTKFQQSYIPDLTKAIAINEKFTFIRELFQNSGNNFSNSIQKLNECDNIEAAFALMEELKHQYLWDTTSSAYLSLCDLVRRRFV